MKLYTDYPLQENEHNKVCPVHQVEAISYDRDKYVEVIHPEFGVHYIKRGYLYEKEGRVGDNPSVSHLTLVWAVPMTSLGEISKEDAAAEIANSVYEATSLYETLEYKRKVRGNGHHIRQKVAAFAVSLMEERWIEKD